MLLFGVRRGLVMLPTRAFGLRLVIIDCIFIIQLETLNRKTEKKKYEHPNTLN